MAQGGAVIDIHPRVVRTAMRDDVAHPQNPLTIVRSKTVGCNNACDSAHGRLALAKGPFEALDAFAAKLRDLWLGHNGCELTTAFVVVPKPPLVVLRETR
jgi:hypothetical protein